MCFDVVALYPLSFIINKSNLKVFRTFIRSQNGLYLEPSFGEIQGFSRMGGHDVYKVNLVRKPTRYWFIVGTKFNSEVVRWRNCNHYGWA